MRSVAERQRANSGLSRRLGGELADTSSNERCNECER